MPGLWPGVLKASTLPASINLNPLLPNCTFVLAFFSSTAFTTILGFNFVVARVLPWLKRTRFDTNSNMIKSTEVELAIWEKYREDQRVLLVL